MKIEIGQVYKTNEEDLIEQQGHCADCEVQAVQGNKEKKQ